MSELEGWCFDCVRPVMAECVAEDHNYRLAVTPEEYDAMRSADGEGKETK